MNDHASASVLGAAVRHRRRHLRLRQDELADLAGTSPRFIHMLEAGKPTVRLDKVLAVLAVLGLGLKITGEHSGLIREEPAEDPS